MNTPTPHQNIKEKGNKKPSVTKVIQSLKESGSEQTFKWYADCTGMFLKEAAIEVAQKVFRYSETHAYDIEDVKNVSLCKALWSKYFDDEDIVEIISIAMEKERDERYNEKVEELLQREKEGRAFIIRPEHSVHVSRTERNIHKLRNLYEEGRRIGESRFDEMLRWLCNA